jgi:adenosylcobyric acid synthase
MARALMLQGTGSDVGKSLLVAGLARAFVRSGLRVRPFKPQNMSNNAAVAADGGEIGRAQALQAQACGVAPITEMNPVLLKPQSESGAQIILHGRLWRATGAGDYRRLAPELLPGVLASFFRLAGDADLVLIEGAGSPAEINLRKGDIANMGFAEAAGVPVVLIGDIERGGVIAQLVGTHALLTTAERALLTGYIVNKFRGDVRLFDDGIAALGERTGLRCFGVVPHFPAAATLPAEDSLALAPIKQPLPDLIEEPLPPLGGEGRVRGAPRAAGIAPSPRLSPPRGRERKKTGRESRLRIAVPLLPRIANFDDFDPLRAEPGVELVFVPAGQPLPRDAALVILPGSKATIGDLEFLRDEGWDIDLVAHRRHGGRILGLCGGYQMLGRTIADPLGMEGPARTVPGLGLLDIDTVLTGSKRLRQAVGIELATGMPVEGYEMHLGTTKGSGLSRPMLRLAGCADGCMNADGLVTGCYMHGLFTSDPFRRAFLAGLGAQASDLAYEHHIEATLDALADHLERNLDLPALLAAARPPTIRRAA